MASYNELNALIDAYINRNGVQAITGQILNGVLKAMVEQLGRGYTIMGAAIPTTDPGTPDGPECYFASEVGTYTDFNGLQVVPGELALLCYTPTDGWTKETIYEGFREVGATIDENVGTPSVGVSYANGVLSFDFRNMKGNTGDAAGFGTIGADITGGVGTPGVTVESSGPATAKNLQFHFTNLKGETGVTSVVATVDNTTGTPACTVSLVGQQLTLAFSGLKGAQGDTGVSADYPIAIVNNLTTNDPASALSAAQGVVLEGEITQLEAEVNGIDNSQDFEFAIVAPGNDYTKSVDIKAGKYNITVVDANNVLPAYTRLYLDGTSIGYVKSLTNPVTISADVSTIQLYSSTAPSTSGNITVKFTDAEPGKSLNDKITELRNYTDEQLDAVNGNMSTMEGEITALQNKVVEGTDTDFMELDPDYNLYRPGKAKVGYYIKGTDGSEDESSSLVASDFIPVEPSTSYHIGGKVLARYYAFYSADKSYISGDNTTTGYITELASPALAKFVRFTGQVGTYQRTIFSKNPLLPADYKYTPKNNVVIPISVSTTELTDVTLKNAGNIIDRSKIIQGAYIDSADGVQKETSDVWLATDWCEIDPSKKYTWFRIQDFYAAFYDEGKNFILGYSTSNRMPNPVTPPANARYARFTMNNSTANAFGVYQSQACWVGADCEHRQPNEYRSYSLPKVVFTERELGAENPCDYTGKEIAVFNKILCIGDSLMYGAENVATGSPYIVDEEPLYNIPTFIKKMSGVETTNAAHSGYSAEQWLAAYEDQDLSGHDAVIIQIGVNNWNDWTGEDDPAIESFKTALGQIIDFAISQNAYDNSGTLKNKPKVFVATQYPAKSYMGITLSIDVLNNAIREVVSGRDDCFLLDMARYSHSNDNIAFNRGHLTALGYRQVAQDYIGIISKFVNDNLDLFVDVPFVGTPATQYEYSPTQR